MAFPPLKNRSAHCGGGIPAQKPCRSNGWPPWPARGGLRVDPVAVPCAGSMGVMHTLRMRLRTMGCRPLRR